MLKKKDLVFLAYLRNNARENLTTISRKTSIPVSTLFDRLQVQKGSLIKRHTTLVDFEKMGYSCRAKVVLSVDKKDKEAVKRFLLSHRNVNSMYKINNGYDYMVEVIFNHMKEMELFLDSLDDRFKINDKRTYYVIDEIRRESFMSDPAEVAGNIDEYKLGIEAGQ